MPLNVDYPDLANLPPGLISGQVVNATGNNTQILSPNVYNLASGSISGAIIALKDWVTQVMAAIFPTRRAMAAPGSSIGLHADTIGGG